MDTTKWKSVAIPIEVYEVLKAISKKENRKITGQLQNMLTEYCRIKNLVIKKKETNSEKS
jgi:hypothetical protein